MRMSNDTRDGLMVGLIAFGAVAAFYSLFDLLASRGPFYTVTLLGLAVFQGLRDPSVLTNPVIPDPHAIERYNALHLALSLVIGVVVVHFAGAAERDPARRMPMLALIVGGFIVTIALVSWLSAPLRSALPVWTIVAANSAAVAVAALWLARARPGIVARILHGATTTRPAD